MNPSASIDALLREAVESGRVPGVVAAAAMPDGVLYGGAAGTRSLPGGRPMTLDTIFWVASMTKAITGIAAMQLVEQGRLALDQPAGEIVDGLRKPLVLEGFDPAGQPSLRPAKRPVTLRALLTHTSGFVYDMWNETMLRYHQQTGLPAVRSGRLAALDAPLLFDPGERWDYGIGIDWAGRMVEAVSGERLDAYFRNHIFAPLGIRDTAYLLSDDQHARRAGMHGRKPDGRLEPLETAPPGEPEFFPGGSAIHTTAGDYLSLLRMLLGGGALDGVRVLRPETVALMGQNHIGDLLVRPLRTAMPELTNDFEALPGMPKKWGLTFLINTEDAPTGRSAGSLAWAGLTNCYYWLDPKKQVAGVLLTQILPFADAEVLRLFESFETAVYSELAAVR